MLEPIFTDWNQAANRHITEEDVDSVRKAIDAALLHRATELAIESAFRFGRDLPVGAVTANPSWITGRYYSGDNRLSWPQMHAETMAIIDSAYNRFVTTPPDTLIVTLEPCDNCQDFIANPNWYQDIKRVGFALPRVEVAERELVKPHSETAIERVTRLGYGYEVFQVEDDQLQKAGRTILDFVKRDLSTGAVVIDTDGLSEALTGLNINA